MQQFLSHWSAVIWGVIGGGAGMWALVKFLPEKTVGHLFDARLERVKGDIKKDVDTQVELVKGDIKRGVDGEVERLKHELGRDAARNDLMFTEVYRRQLDVIERLYAAISDLQAGLVSYTAPIALDTDFFLEERLGTVASALSRVTKVYYPGRIWFSTEMQLMVEDYLALVNKAADERVLAEDPRPREEQLEHWDSAWNIANVSGEEMRCALECEFKKVLGVVHAGALTQDGA